MKLPRPQQHESVTVATSAVQEVYPWEHSRNGKYLDQAFGDSFSIETTGMLSARCTPFMQRQKAQHSQRLLVHVSLKVAVGCQQDPAVGAVSVLKWGGILNEALHGADPTK